MRRTWLLFLGLVLTVGAIGCSKEETTPTSTDDAAPTGDADADGDANATDDAAADPAEK
jgi:hypothetical protein